MVEKVTAIHLDAIDSTNTYAKITFLTIQIPTARDTFKILIVLMYSNINSIDVL